MTDPVDAELEQMAGSRKMAEELRRNLETLREGAAGPALAEMANDILDGRITMRDVASSTAYMAPLTQAMDQFHEAMEQLTEQERADLLAETESRLLEEESKPAE